MTPQFERVADALFSAYATRQPIAPPRLTLPELDLAGAYAIQQFQERAFESQGHRVVGRKIGLTSLAMQQQLGVDSPDFGFFTDRMVYSEGDSIDVSQFIDPKIETELAFRLGMDLALDADFDAVVAAVDKTYLAAEIIDSRVRDWDIRLVDTVADNASCGAVVIGKTPIDVPVSELPEVAVTMRIDGATRGAGTGADVMGHPLNPLVWLARTLGEQGVTLRAGDLILTGSFCGAAPVAAGATVLCDYGHLGALTAHFQ